MNSVSSIKTALPKGHSSYEEALVATLPTLEHSVNALENTEITKENARYLAEQCLLLVHTYGNVVEKAIVKDSNGAGLLTTAIAAMAKCYWEDKQSELMGIAPSLATLAKMACKTFEQNGTFCPLNLLPSNFLKGIDFEGTPGSNLKVKLHLVNLLESLSTSIGEAVSRQDTTNDLNLGFYRSGVQAFGLKKSHQVSQHTDRFYATPAGLSLYFADVAQGLNDGEERAIHCRYSREEFKKFRGSDCDFTLARTGDKITVKFDGKEFAFSRTSRQILTNENTNKFFSAIQKSSGIYSIALEEGLPRPSRVGQYLTKKSDKPLTVACQALYDGNTEQLELSLRSLDLSLRSTEMANSLIASFSEALVAGDLGVVRTFMNQAGPSKAPAFWQEIQNAWNNSTDKGAYCAKLVARLAQALEAKPDESRELFGYIKDLFQSQRAAVEEFAASGSLVLNCALDTCSEAAAANLLEGLETLDGKEITDKNIFLLRCRSASKAGNLDAMKKCMSDHRWLTLSSDIRDNTAGIFKKNYSGLSELMGVDTSLPELKSSEAALNFSMLLNLELISNETLLGKIASQISTDQIDNLPTLRAFVAQLDQLGHRTLASNIHKTAGAKLCELLTIAADKDDSSSLEKIITELKEFPPISPVALKTIGSLCEKYQNNPVALQCVANGIFALASSSTELMRELVLKPLGDKSEATIFRRLIESYSTRALSSIASLLESAKALPLSPQESANLLKTLDEAQGERKWWRLNIRKDFAAYKALKKEYPGDYKELKACKAALKS